MLRYPLRILMDPSFSLFRALFILFWILWASQVVLAVKNPPANAGDVRDVGLIPGLGRSPGGGHGNPLQYSCLENPCREEPGGPPSIGSQSRTQLKQLSMQHTQAGPGCHFLLQGIFLTQRSNPRLLHLRHCQEDSLPLAPSGKPLFSKHNLPKFICNVLK